MGDERDDDVRDAAEAIDRDEQAKAELEWL
jgi:hypothetical protein